MEALLYRFLCDELQPMLTGRRLERVYSPRLGWWTFRLQPSEHPRYLLFAHHPSSVALTLSSRSPENPPIPTAQVMWLRKRVQGLRVLEIQSDWVNRRMALGMGLHSPEIWLLLDAKKGVLAELQPMLQDVQPPSWPDMSELVGNKEVWQSSPQISPLLRQTLEVLPEPDGKSLYSSLQGRQDAQYFVYTSQHGPRAASTWRLPESLREKLNLSEQRHTSAFAAANQLAEHLFFPVPSLTPDAVSTNRAAKRKKRLLKHLDEDEKRLREFSRLADQAQLIRQNLYQLPARTRTDRITVTDDQEEAVELFLDGQKTILENMERWFQLADKGKRGLEHVHRRRMATLSQEASFPSTALQPKSLRRQKATSMNTAGQAESDRALSVHRFLSSDGFVILRGKNQKANHALLTKAASPFDFWFHAADAPGAHVILKRNTPEQDVPEQTLHQAAVLAGLASHFAGAGRASIICAQVKYVRTVKGAPGLARVDKVLRTLHVDLDPELENRLRMDRAR